ncbi:MAG: hypothetical protein IT384_14075 [Deltaproteobacteria bacterium]|nr:hypothetical protein [Deltaproteobacteria bacterium]
MPPRLPLSTFILLTAACAPATPIRRSALVPASAPPARLGVPLSAGQTQLTGDVGPIRDPYPISIAPFSPAPTFDFTPRVGDPGLLVPTVTLGASAYHAVSRHLELGGQIRYAHYSWSEPTAIGVLPIPEGQGAFVLYGGPGLRLNVPIADLPLTFSSLLELNLAHLSEAHFFCAPCSAEPPRVEYRFDGMTDTTWLLPKVAFLLDVRAVEALHVYGGVAAEAGFHNVGFETNLATRGESSIGQHFVGMPLLGLAADLAGVTLAATFSIPLSDEKTLDRPGVNVSLGYRWGMRMDASSSAQRPPATLSVPPVM